MSDKKTARETMESATRKQSESEEQARQAESAPHDWGDDAAAARTADDTRARAPHDRSGTPSTGEAGV